MECEFFVTQTWNIYKNAIPWEQLVVQERMLQLIAKMMSWKDSATLLDNNRIPHQICKTFYFASLCFDIITAKATKYFMQSRFTPCLLMPWVFALPVRQQVWYWLCEIDTVLYSLVSFSCQKPSQFSCQWCVYVHSIISMYIIMFPYQMQ